MALYKPSKIERKWQKYWQTKKLNLAKDSAAGRRNEMVLVEFPYPSGNLHMGHWYAFALPDMYARYRRMLGHNVMYPIGFDAFGLPAENAAIKRNIHPEKWTKQNIAHMTKQLASMGAIFDWSRVVSTIDPEYYRWTQWMFLKFFEKDLAYRAKTQVNWCPKDKTVLANEQVLDGHCERCGSEVQQRELEQWMLRITAYADRLIDDINGLDWPNTTQSAQRNWIGRSEGARIVWKLKVPGQSAERQMVETFTTRPDTLYGVTFLVISPELAKQWFDQGWQSPKEVKNYVSQSLRKRELERLEGARNKTGVFTGIHAINPLTQELVPVWVADYVLGGYGTGAIMAVPAHDQRDYEFAKAFRLPIRQVIRSSDDGEQWSVNSGRAYEGGGVLVNSGPYDGRSAEEASKSITNKLKELGLGGAQKTYKLRDWVLSRQRYWGVPIPVIKCPECGHVPVAEKDLPVKLPPLKDFKPADDGRSPLAKATKWLKVKCPKCKGPAERETDTMDTFVDSSWYYIRYTDPKNKKKFADQAKMKKWLPVAMYIGGAEHNTMHLLYSRFFAKALADLKQLSFEEPFSARRNHGIILGPDGQKMSKSQGNVIDPDKEVSQYGADTVRMYLAFMAPYEQGGPWDPKGINGVARFLQRAKKLLDMNYEPKARSSDEAKRAVHKYIKEVGEDLESLRLNTGVSGLMKLLNELEAQGPIGKNEAESFVKILAPFAPHFAEEMWQVTLKNKKSVHLERWPKYDHKMLTRETVQLPVQVNGKLRDTIVISPYALQDDAVFTARASENVARHIAGREIRKIIYIPGKMLNLVVGD